MQTYLTSVNGHADPNAIYLVDGGANDAGAIASFMDPAAGQAYMVSEANAMAQSLEQLHADGAQYFVISDNTGGGGQFGLTYFAQLQNDLSTAGIPFVTADLSELVLAIEANPTAYGIVDANEPPTGTAYNPYNPADGGADVNPDPSVISTSWSLDATQLQSPTAGQTNLWADDLHLSAAGQAIEANYLFNLIENAVPKVGETLTASPTLAESNANPANVTYTWQSSLDGHTWNSVGATGATFTVQ